MKHDNRLDIHIDGDVSGQIIAGDNNTVIRGSGTARERSDSHNSATGSTTGHSMQAGTISGDVHFHQAADDAAGQDS
ncbi:hypothetical protein Lesp02_73540 [Lentzea sp. NBRC 105346]|uniref:hypothetical protein n=1 Tax=Lentzea sp. NBRC 105346 TaxID=3032205 RepID=UPI0024A394FC|nr:hypothetical protein [Lentzea sp. NBRC 105346]GLZ35167.1 hypothetical protein Lesp02_73540 [Lentzea sp. NBRC 105346]